jgi:hypothetical protein
MSPPAAIPDYALVRWLTGVNEGELTSNVKTTWIRAFDGEGVGDPGRSFVVEWRQPPKPRCGWPLFDAEILDVSSKYWSNF